ncbi:MAG: DUF3107 domain-containing protein [Nocardioides sp.]
MEVKIGVRHASRELVIDTPDTAEEIEARLVEAVSSEGLLTLTDSRGRRVLVPSAGIAYLEIGTSVTGQVGFRG